jgi:hypothetical protein
MKRTILLGALAAVTLASSARADERSGVLESRHHRYESPQHFALEFRFSPYRPNIDDDPSLGGATPYRDTFGTMPRLLAAVEFDWQALRIPHVGTLGPGFSIGYTEMTDKAVLASDPTRRSDEDTNLEIFPMYAVAVFRADVFMQEMRIPLVPYVKGGVGYALWRASTNLGTSQAADATTGNNVSGKGHTWGTHVAAGLALHLNTFDNAAARNLDNSVGINHTYVFIEYMLSQLTGLGQAHALYVGANTWTAGLTFEM